MQSFKIKNTKKVVKDKRVTIDAKHKSVIKSIDNKNSKIKKLNIKKNKLLNKQKKIDRCSNEYHLIEDEIIDIQNEIKTLLNDDYDRNDYYIDNGKILYGYYKSTSSRDQSSSLLKNKNKKSKSKSKNKTESLSNDNNNNDDKLKSMIYLTDNSKKDIFFYLNNKNNTSSLNNDSLKSSSTSINNKQSSSSSSDDEIDNNSLKSIVFEDQSSIIRSYMNKMNPEKYSIAENSYRVTNICQDCNCEYILSDLQEFYVCPKCGQIKDTVLDNDVPSNVKTSEVSTFSYQRVHHFKDCLAQFQAKESTNIPQDVIDKIKDELTKYRVTDYSRLTPKLLRKFLKKLKLSTYYEHIPHIIYRISGKPAPKIPAHVEERLLKHFLQAEEIFMELLSSNSLSKLGIKNRKNIMRYTFMFYKLFELEGMYEFLDYLILLKCRKKLHKQDQIWKEICAKAGWQFKPTDWARI